MHSMQAPSKATPAFETVAVQVCEKVVVIELNRPSTGNAISLQLYKDLIAALAYADSLPAPVAVTYLTARGRFFSVGADVTEQPAAGLGPPPLEDQAATGWYYEERFQRTIARAARALARHSKILVVGLNGPAVGVAAALASHGDIIYASSAASVHMLFSQLALTPEAGSSATFVRRMQARGGMGKAMEVLALNKKMQADEMLQCGFVDRVFPAATFETEARQAVDKMVQGNSWASLQVTKRLVQSSGDALHHEAVDMTVQREVEALVTRFQSGQPQAIFARLKEKHTQGRKPSKM